MVELIFRPVWFDSLGAKSSCTLVKTPDLSLLIDPGIAVMQPSFPASTTEKLAWLDEGMMEIKKACGEADVIVISHYHYDHYLPHELEILRGKLLLVKNPNEYINDSQRERAERFFGGLCERFGGLSLADVLGERTVREYRNPIEGLPVAREKDFGTYNNRRSELLAKGERWFLKRIKRWNQYPRIPEIKFDQLDVKFPEGRTFRFGETLLTFSNPLFHGIEFSRVGWVFSTMIEYRGEKLLHSSDLDGPIIEDYADAILEADPDILILDGPATYMLGYMLNRTNLNRAIDNARRIVEGIDTSVIIYDHHLTREPRFREHTKPVWEASKRCRRRLTTAAEFIGREPIVESLVKK